VPRSADRSMLRLEIRAGEIAVRDSRLVRIEACLNNGVARVRDLATGEIDEVAIATLRARSSIAHGPEIDAHLEAARSSKAVPWQRAADREQVLAALFDGSGAWGERAQQIANAQGISRRTLYRWLARYRDVATTSALIPIPRGTRRHHPHGGKQPRSTCGAAHTPLLAPV
jgi:Helix-turn-helix domain